MMSGKRLGQITNFLLTHPALLEESDAELLWQLKQAGIYHPHVTLSHISFSGIRDTVRALQQARKS